MTCSITSQKRRQQSSQGGDNIDMAGHSGMEGSRCNAIIKKLESMQFEIISTSSFHLYFVMTINFFCRWIENGCTTVIEEPTFYQGIGNFFGDYCRIKEARKYVWYSLHMMPIHLLLL
jgi:hypothetical protein